MDLKLIEERLRAGAVLSWGEQNHLRELTHAEGQMDTSRAVFLLYKYPVETGVSQKDRELFERLFDGMTSTHTRALLLSLLCNWLSLAQKEIGRLLVGLSDRTDDEEDFLCIKACSLAGMALAERFDPDLASGLLNVFYDQERLPGTQESAIDALLSLDGASSGEIVTALEEDPAGSRNRAEKVAERLAAQIVECRRR